MIQNSELFENLALKLGIDVGFVLYGKEPAAS